MTVATSREIVTSVLRALAECGQSKTAEAANLSDTRLSRWKSTSSEGGGLDLEETAAVLVALGLQVVPIDPQGMVTVPATSYNAIHVLLRDYADAVVVGRTKACK